MLEKIKALIAVRESAVPAEDITRDTNFYLDLGWTSLDMIGCITDVEGLIGQEIPDDKLNGIQTVGDLMDVMGVS